MAKPWGSVEDDDDTNLPSFPPLITRLSRRAVDVGDESLATRQQSLSGSPPSLDTPVDERSGERGGEHTDQGDAPATSVLSGIEEMSLPSDQHTLHQPVQHRVEIETSLPPPPPPTPPPPLVESIVEARRLLPAAAEVARVSDEGAEEANPHSKGLPPPLSGEESAWTTAAAHPGSNERALDHRQVGMVGIQPRAPEQALELNGKYRAAPAAAPALPSRPTVVLDTGHFSHSASSLEGGSDHESQRQYAAAAVAAALGAGSSAQPSGSGCWNTSAREGETAGDEIVMRDEVSAGICEAGCQSVLRTECGQDNTGATYVEDEPRTSNTTTLRYAKSPAPLPTERTSPGSPSRDHEQRSHGATLMGQEGRREDESAYFQNRDQTHPITVPGNDRGTLRRDGSNLKPTPSEDTTIYSRADKYDGAAKTIGEKLAHGCQDHHGHNESGKLSEPSVQHLPHTLTAPHVATDDSGGFRTATFDNHTRCTTDDMVDPERDSKAEESSLQGGGTTGGGEAAWSPSPPSSSKSLGTKSYAPHRQHDAWPERRGGARASSLDFRSLSFVERQEYEHLAAEHRHEGLVRAEEEARRELAAGGSWMNRTSRAILARSSSLPYGGGEGRSSSSPPGTGAWRQGPSVFERLARRSSERDCTDNKEWAQEAPVGGDGDRDGGDCRQPFTPMINPRSSLLAVSHRNEDDCPQQRLYRDGEEQRRRRERRVQLAEQALRERSVSRHVNAESERVLARRNRSRVIRLHSKMMEVLKAIDTERTGWLSFAGLEHVLSECEMLPVQAPPEIYNDVLLAVWTALSQRSSCSGSDDGSGGGDDGTRDGYARFGREERRETCGVAVERLSVLLSCVASWSYGYEWTNSSDTNTSFGCLHQNPQKTVRKPLPSNPANSRLWGDDKEEREMKSPEPDAFATVLQCDEHFEDLCKYLSDIFTTNQRHREKRTNKSDQPQERQTRAGTEIQGPEAMAMARGRTGAPATVATPAQVAATTARFEEQIRAKERKIELLRRAEEARTKIAHPFEPSMATKSTPQATAVRRAVGCGGRSDGVVDEGQQQKNTDARTTEERELDDNCTFQPRLFRPLPLPPPRYPTQKSTHNRGRGDSNSADEASPRTSDRATASWMAQVARLKAGRKDHLRHLEQKQAADFRPGPLPPSVQQLLCDSGIETSPQPQNIAAAGGATKQDNDGRFSKQKGGNPQGPISRNLSSSPPRLRLEARMRARDRLKQKRSEEQARQSAEESVRRQKQQRLLARARKKSAAVVGLEAALSAREAERGRPSWSDPPSLIAEVEFVRQKTWVLLPLWADTCPREAAIELAQQQPGAVVGTVAADLETSFRDEIQRACEQATGLGLEREQEALGIGKADRGDNHRRAVPKVVLRVDVGG